MNPIVRYGSESSFALESSGDGPLVECGRPRMEPLADCRLGVAEALAKPLGYPPLAKTTTEDDRIVLAVGSPLPRAAEIVAAVIETLIDSGVNPGGITVLQAKTSSADACQKIPDDIRQRIRSAWHDPEDSDQMTYLATTTAGEPVMLSRLLTDADFVLPIGCVQDAEANGYFGVNSPIFPIFSDKNTQSRFRAAQSPDNQPHDKSEDQGYEVDSEIDSEIDEEDIYEDDIEIEDREGEAFGDESAEKKRRLTAEADEVGWLLGVTFSIQVIPGTGDEVLQIVAGEIGKVRECARRSFDDAWQHSVAAEAQLVVATIEGGPRQQSWQNLARAVANAATLVEEDGAIAVVCELAAEPGPAVRHLAQAPSRREAMEEIRQNPLEDAPVATQLAQTLQRNHVYLMSNLDDSLLEDLEITPIASPHELNRLVAGVTGHGDTCILLCDAPSAKVSIQKI